MQEFEFEFFELSFFVSDNAQEYTVLSPILPCRDCFSSILTEQIVSYRHTHTHIYMLSCLSHVYTISHLISASS